MFNCESEMTESVAQWMRNLGLTVRSEFITPWGVCDLVGLSFDKRKVEHRLRLGQIKPVTTVTRAAVLLQVPDVESGESLSVAELGRLWGEIPEDTVMLEASRLVRDGFLICQDGRVQKRNGWMPLHRRLLAVELKLHRVEDAIQQAQNNLGFTGESYIALPLNVALRTLRRRKAELRQKGIGVLGVHEEGCERLISPNAMSAAISPIVQFHCVEKFWRDRSKAS